MVFLLSLRTLNFFVLSSHVKSNQNSFTNCAISQLASKIKIDESETPKSGEETTKKIGLEPPKLKIDIQLKIFDFFGNLSS